jgi:Ca2+-binding EF-hand superfamily protein
LGVLTDECCARFLEKKQASLPDEEELERLLELTFRINTPPVGRNERLNYDAFMQIAALVSARTRVFFKPSVFLRFPRDSLQRISARAFFHYVVRRVGLTQIRIALTCFDEVGHGYLREHDLENYIYDAIPGLPQLQSLEPDFYPYYVFTAVRKFAFFLDPLRKGRIAIRDLVASPILREFNELRQVRPDDHSTGAGLGMHGVAGVTPSATAAAAAGAAAAGAASGAHGGVSGVPGGGASSMMVGGGAPGPATAPVPAAGATESDSDWFTARAALRTYAHYLQLDVDHNGMLSKEEFRGFQNGILTNAIVDRLFQECRMYKGESGRLEMDYKAFLDFVLAMQNKDTPQGLAYFWRLLDIDQCGYLTAAHITYFFKSVIEQMVANGYDPVRSEDIVNEIFDMVRPKDPDRITLRDLVHCGVGDVVVSILTDMHSFWTYDNREMLIAQDMEENG